MLKRFMEIETEYNIDLTGNSQDGFKKHKSTIPAGLTLQSIIASHVDIGEYMLLASLNLSAAFDISNDNLFKIITN